MSEQFRDGAKRCAFRDQPRRERVSQVMPGEVLDACALECGVKRVLHVPNRLAGLATGGVREHKCTGWDALVVERLQCGERCRVQRQRVWTTTFRSRDADDSVQEVHLIPPKMEQAAAA